jgi:hypothetical protein
VPEAWLGRQAVNDDAEALLMDMANAILTMRRYFMGVAEQHPDMDTSALDDLLRRYRELVA